MCETVININFFHEPVPIYSKKVQFTKKLKKFGSLSPTALRKANIAYNFGLSECSRVKITITKTVLLIEPFWFYNAVMHRKDAELMD